MALREEIHAETCHNGHLNDCESLNPAWDLGDLVARKACAGCCPHGTKPRGLQALQDLTTFRVQYQLGVSLDNRPNVHP
jgi:hypothetical protein